MKKKHKRTGKQNEICLLFWTACSLRWLPSFCVLEMSAKSEAHLVGTVQNRVLSQLHLQQSSFEQIQRTDSHKLPSYLIGHKAVRSLSSKQDRRKVCKSSGVPTFVFTLKNRKILRYSTSTKTFTPIKCAFDVIQHTSWLVLLAAFLFPLASRPSNCRKALDQIFKVCRTALLQRSESRRLEAFKDNHANVSISLGVGENCCMKFWGGPFDMYIYTRRMRMEASEPPGILLYKHPFSQPTWFCKDKLCTKRFCSMQKKLSQQTF